MKKIIMISMIAIAALGMIGCGAEDDDTKADMKWTNTTSNGTAVTDITWVKSGQVDQTWSGTYDADGSETDPKGIKELVGYGECFLGTAPAEITIDPSSEGVAASDGLTATIVENSVANLEIVSTAKK